MAKVMRAAIYTRVSTTEQTTANQTRELETQAAHRGWEVVKSYTDDGISGAKGRDQRPGLDAALKDATKRKYDVLMVWAVDRLGRSLIDLVKALQELHGAKVDLFILSSGIDTTTPGGRALYQMMGVFSEFEREMIKARISAGVARIKAGGATKSGKPTGRPAATLDLEQRIRAQLATPYGGRPTTGIGTTAKLLRCGVSTVARVKAAMDAEQGATA
jgi:DNA invertase Pin-like site-specific DNA recombinase